MKWYARRTRFETEALGNSDMAYYSNHNNTNCVLNQSEHVIESETGGQRGKSNVNQSKYDSVSIPCVSCFSDRLTAGNRIFNTTA